MIIMLHEPNTEVSTRGAFLPMAKNAVSKLASIVYGFSQWFV